jgi:hypothetical protein
MESVNEIFDGSVADGRRALAAGGVELPADLEVGDLDLSDTDLALWAARSVSGPVPNAERARRLALCFAKKLLLQKWPCATARNQPQLEASYVAWSVPVFVALITKREAQ